MSGSSNGLTNTLTAVRRAVIKGQHTSARHRTSARALGKGGTAANPILLTLTSSPSLCLYIAGSHQPYMQAKSTIFLQNALYLPGISTSAFHHDSRISASSSSSSNPRALTAVRLLVGALRHRDPSKANKPSRPTASTY